MIRFELVTACSPKTVSMSFFCSVTTIIYTSICLRSRSYKRLSPTQTVNPCKGGIIFRSTQTIFSTRIVEELSLPVGY